MYLRCCSHSRIFIPAATGLVRSGRSASGWLVEKSGHPPCRFRLLRQHCHCHSHRLSCVKRANERRSWALHSFHSSRLAVIAATNSRPQTQWLTDWASRRTGAPVMRCHTSRLQWQCAPTPAGTITRTAHGWARAACRAHSSRRVEADVSALGCRWTGLALRDDPQHSGHSGSKLSGRSQIVEPASR